MESYINISEIQKTKHQYFNFYLNYLIEEEDKKYINNIFNIPNLPLIGYKNNEKKNNNNSHLLGKLLSLVSFQIDICQGKKENEINQLFSDFVLPSNLNEYLNINDVIEIDNNTDEPDVNLFFMPKQKLNFYFIISELPFYPNNKNYENINFFEDSSNKDNKGFIDKINNKYNNNKINIINDNNYDNNLNQINFINENEEEIKDCKFDINEEEEEIIDDNSNDFFIYNIIPHFFYLNGNEKDLLEIKNLIFNEQITLFSIDDKDYYDIDKENNKKFIDINNLREESSNIILNDNCNFEIKPDNLKFYLNVKKDLSQFYIIYTNVQQDHHSVFYYITCNNVEAKNKMVKLLNKSMTLKEMIKEIEKTFGKIDIVYNLKKIFCNN